MLSYVYFIEALGLNFLRYMHLLWFCTTINGSWNDVEEVRHVKTLS